MKDAAACPHCGGFQPTSISVRAQPLLADAEVEPSIRLIRIGELLEGHWRILRKLGAGGMGAVYLAEDIHLHRMVAIKVLASRYADDEELLARFEREARVTAALEHPHIVPVYAVGRIENRPFLVMKNLEGQTLASLLRNEGALSRERTLALLTQLAAGLDFIHQKGFVHRDIKSGNIFVGSDGHATLLDFGILRGKDDGGAALTRTGMVMGSPHYMSPEQARGARDVDHRADLYALAVVLYECLSGTLPFGGDSDLSTVQLQAHAAPPDLCERAPWVPRAVGQVLLRAMSKNPQDRYSSAAELREAVESAFAAGDRGADLPAPSRRWWPAAAALALAFLLGGAVAVGPQLKAALGSHAPAPHLLPASSVGRVAVKLPAPEKLAEPIPDPPDPVLPPAKEEPPAKSSAGELSVVSTWKGQPYWATVLVDGKRMGTTPMTFQLPVGAHQVRVERVGFRSVEQKIKVSPGRAAVLRFPLKP